MPILSLKVQGGELSFLTEGKMDLNGMRNGKGSMNRLRRLRSTINLGVEESRLGIVNVLEKETLPEAGSNTPSSTMS